MGESKQAQQSDAAFSGLCAGLVVESEALAHGLETLLLKSPLVGRVRTMSPASLPDVIERGAVDFLVISVDRWELLADFPGLGESHGPKVLVVGDGLHRRDAAMFSSLPAGGFAETAELSTDRIGDVLIQFLEGQMPMPSQMARRLLSGSPHAVVGADRRSVALTPRERETLALLVEGLSNKQVARALGISTHGAKRLVTAILLKLGAPNRTAAVVTALKLELT